MIKIKKTNWLKYIYIRNEKKIEIRFYKDKNKPKSILINPDHIFLDGKGFRTIFVRDNASESMNPLDFNSVMDRELFNTAINNKLIKDTFSTIEDNKMDLVKVLLIGILVGVLVILFMLWQGGVVEL